MARFQVKADGLTTFSRFSRQYAVVDMQRRDHAGYPLPVLETNDIDRALSFAAELNNAIS